MDGNLPWPKRIRVLAVGRRRARRRRGAKRAVRLGVPALALLAVLGWTAFFGWVNQREILAGASPGNGSGWIVDWSVPVVLVIGLWLVAMRNSRREAARFAVAAQALSTRSQRLEERLTAVNRELSLARDFIAAQSRDLESLGRVASRAHLAQCRPLQT